VRPGDGVEPSTAASCDAPAAESDRIVALDALRGIALAGVLVVNAVTAYRVSIFEQYLPRSPDGSGIDRIVARVVEIGIQSAPFALFSLLFGVGLAALHERMPADARRRVLARRLAALLGIGLLHMVFVHAGDILAFYALVGIVAVPLLALSTRALLGVALAMFVVHLLPIAWPTPFSSFEDVERHVAEATFVYGYGSYREALAFRISEIPRTSALLLYWAPRTLGLFALGACVWRSRLLRGERRALVTATAVVGLVAGVAMVWTGRTGVTRWSEPLSNVGVVVLALGYGATVLVCHRSRLVARGLGPFVSVGRTALTSYLAGSVALASALHGRGPAPSDRAGEAEAAVVAILVFVALSIASAAWLARHRFGPVEWLWRSITYGARQPMRR